VRNALINELVKLAKSNPRIHVILPDIGVFAFKQAGFPEKQLHNVGICEAAAVQIASGLAIAGQVPIVYSIAAFSTARCFEQIKMACYNNLPIKIVGVGAGLNYSHEGPTHHACEDIAIMRALPDMHIYSPCSSDETSLITVQMVNNCKPSYIRLTASPSSNINYNMKESLPFMCAVANINAKVAIITTGSILDNVLSAIEGPVLGYYDERFSVYSMSQLWPISYSDKGPDMISVLKNHKIIITIEEHVVYGGLGTIITEVCRNYDIQANIWPIGIPNNQFCPRCGTREEVLEWAGLTAEHIKGGLSCIVKS